MTKTMASYAFRTPPRVAHAKPPGPKCFLDQDRLDLSSYQTIIVSLGNNTLNLSLISKFALSKSSGKMNCQLALLPPDWSDFESIFHRL